MPTRAPITFEPTRVTVWVEPGTTVLDAARAGRVAVTATCGGRGTCGDCAVRVVAGKLSPTGEVERATLRNAPETVRLACQAHVNGPVAVRPMMARETRAQLGEFPRDAVLAAGVDLGTTNITAVVVDATSGEQVGRATVPNSQSSWGADVLSRLSASLDGHAAALRDAAEISVAEALVAAAGVAASRIERVAIAGNSVMSTLLAGVDAAPLASHPFTAPRLEELLAEPSAIHVAIAPGARVWLVPGVGGFVGGDAVAGIVATRLGQDEEAALLVDVGTNAEVVLARGGGLLAASAPAGPAFEGGGIRSAGPAVDGAIVGVSLVSADQLALRTIGDCTAAAFSGAGLLSALALLRAFGHLDASGLMHESGPLSARFARDANGVLGVGFGDSVDELRITQLDIRELQLAKAAVRAAVETTLESGGIVAADLDRVVIAGAFGAALDAGDLIGLGLLPSETEGRIEFAGDTAVAGAVAMAVEESAQIEAVVAAERTGHIDLAHSESFNACLMRSVTLEEYSA